MSGEDHEELSVDSGGHYMCQFFQLYICQEEFVLTCDQSACYILRSGTASPVYLQCFQVSRQDKTDQRGEPYENERVERDGQAECMTGDTFHIEICYCCRDDQFLKSY